MNKSEHPGHLQQSGRTRAAAVNSDDIAIRALRFFAEDPDQAQRFFAWSGLEPSGLREAAGQSGFAAGILDFLVQDEAVLVSFARHAGLDPGDLARTQERLRARENWTGDDL